MKRGEEMRCDMSGAGGTCSALGGDGCCLRYTASARAASMALGTVRTLRARQHLLERLVRVAAHHLREVRGHRGVLSKELHYASNALRLTSSCPWIMRSTLSTSEPLIPSRAQSTSRVFSSSCSRAFASRREIVVGMERSPGCLRYRDRRNPRLARPAACASRTKAQHRNRRRVPRRPQAVRAVMMRSHRAESRMEPLRDDPWAFQTLGRRRAWTSSSRAAGVW